MNQPDQSDESQVRRSQRFKWLVLGGFALLVSATLLGVLLIPWDVKPPIAPDLEFKPLELKPAENAFTYFEAAGKMPVKKSVPREWYGYVLNGDMAKPIGSPDEQWDPALVGEILAENTAVLAEVEKGLACQRYASPVIESERSLMPWMASHRMLVSLLFQKSKQRQLAGDYAGATASGIQMLRFGWLMVDNPDSFLEWHYGVDYERMALARLEELAADAKMPDPVLREIQAVLDHWDPQGPVKGFRQAIVVEYGLMRNSMMEFPRRDFENSELVWFFSKLPYAWKPNMIKHLLVSGSRNYIANADRSYATRITSDFPAKSQVPDGRFGKIAFYASPNSIGKRMVVEGVFGTVLSSDNLLSRKYQLQAHVAALRLKIALRLYEQKHGQLPDDLNALVPEFIREIPKDPYDDKPFRYSKIEKKVWAVGMDLADDGGKAFFDRSSEYKVWRDRIMGKSISGYDLVMPLGTRELKPTLAPIPTRKGSSTP